MLTRLVHLLFLVSALVGLLLVPRWVSRHPWRQERAAMEAEVAALRQRNEELQRRSLYLVEQLDALEHDADFRERVLRARMHLGWANEVIVRFDEGR